MAATDERREADRDQLERMAELRWGGRGQEKATCLLQNFSLRGLYLHAAESLRKKVTEGDSVSCKFRLPAELPSVGGMPVVCRGVVKRCEKIEGERETLGIAVEVDSILFV